jgi:hypothetical protein
MIGRAIWHKPAQTASASALARDRARTRIAMTPFDRFCCRTLRSFSPHAGAGFAANCIALAFCAEYYLNW